MTTGITPDTFYETSYLTVAEYKDAPTSIDYDNLVVGGNGAAQDAELARVILRASSYMDEYLNQSVVATKYTETQRTRITPQGYISLHPNCSPIISLEAFSYGPYPGSLTAIPDCSYAWFESQQMIIPLSQIATTYSSQGPLGFGGGLGATSQVFTEYQYVAGFVNTVTITAVAAATSLIVKDGTGIIAGQRLRIYDGSKSEQVTVASTYTYGSSTVPLTSALVYSHDAGAAIGNLPNSLKQACILITTAFIKARGDNSMTMQITTQPTASLISSANRYGSEIALALDMVDKYRRIR
jgi:hypothetical protein